MCIAGARGPERQTATSQARDRTAGVTVKMAPAAAVTDRCVRLAQEGRRAEPTNQDRQGTGRQLARVPLGYPEVPCGCFGAGFRSQERVLSDS